jgi:cytochrome d ubiquinol oxidase subunit I
VTNLLYARWLMGLSLAFHIVFAAIGVAFPLLMSVAEWRWWRTGDEAYLEVARRWAKGTAIIFAVGAVSGTVISFELGLLWPEFMSFAGAIIGLPFSLEGFAFFTEATFLGIYLYGWRRVGPRLHLAAGLIVALSGAASAFFVTLANAWMNNPAGFDVRGGKPTGIEPLVAMFSPGWAHEVVHVLISCYAATGLAVAAIHALYLLRQPASRFHRAALALSLWVGGLAAVVQPISGDFSAREVAETQPVKLAALEGQFKTERGAPLRIGGIPNVETRSTPYAIDVPYGLSLLAFHNPHAVVRGLDAFPRDRWPNTLLVHLSFQVMVACGGVIALVAIVALVLAWRAGWRVSTSRRFLGAIVATGPLGFVALEAGWLVTEWGRQPFTVAHTMRTAAAVTPVPGLALPFWVFTAIYVFLAVMVVVLLGRQIRHAPPLEDAMPDAPHPQEGVEP